MDTKDKLVTLEDLKAVHDEVARYTTCSTAASTAAKTAALTNFVLATGASVRVKFTYSNTAANPTLNINSTGAKAIVKYGSTAVGTTPTESWDAGSVVGFVYDGTSWIMQTRTDVDAVPKSTGGTFSGLVQIDEANGTTSTQGWSSLIIGNDKATGTEENSAGDLQIYGRTSYKTEIISLPNSPTANRVITIPDESGTLMTNQGGTFIKPVVIDEQNGTTSSLGASHLTLGNSIASGTAGNSTASLVMYGRQSYYTALYTAETLTSNRSIYFPNRGGTLALISDIQIRTVAINFSISANGQFNTNLYTVINNDLPSGYRCLGTVGFSTNNQVIVPVAIFYGNSSWSFQVKNLSSSDLNNQHADIYYLASPSI